MKKQRIKIEVEVDMDPVPGWGNKPSDYVEHIQEQLDRTIRHYNPEVKFVSRVHEPTVVVHQDMTE